ncbi:MAG: DUF4397 domain-containing protein [Chitinophagaceae bacterium]|nr:DUF4397 domain-containing protein [Chitinophagaceae bacterium]
MKKIVYSFVAVIAVGLGACNKDAITLNTDASASVAVLYASPGSPTADIVVDGLVSNGSRRLSYGTLSSLGGGGGNGGIYIPLLNGSRSIKISPDSGKTNLVDASYQFDANKSYTVVVYDTLASTGAQTLRSVQLTDDLTPPTGTNTHVRFLHLAPNAPAIDVTLVRGANLDSVTITNRTYFGASPNATALSAFQPVTGGTAYTLRVKLAGTQTLVSSVNLGTTLTSGRIITLVAAGSAKSQPLAFAALRHY